MKALMILLLFPILTISKLEAQEIYECPPGSLLVTFEFPYNHIFECDIIVKYCCWWDNDAKTLRKTILEYYAKNASTSGSSCLLDVEDWDHFNNHLTFAVSLHMNIICWPELPPCDEIPPVINYIEVTNFTCKYIESVLEYPNDDTYSLRFRNCWTSGKCNYLYTICYDYSQYPPLTMMQFVGKQLHGYSNCSILFPQLPPQGYDWNEPWTTECFNILNCN